MTNTLYYGDNLPILRSLLPETGTFMAAQRVMKEKGKQGKVGI